jgi:hypothetical protein
MTAKTGLVDEYAFVAEGLSGTACSAALMHVRELARFAPPGRAFSAIATLTDYSERIEANLAASQQSLASGRQGSALRELDRAVSLLNDMAQAALGLAERVEAGRQRTGSAA